MGGSRRFLGLVIALVALGAGCDNGGGGGGTTTTTTSTTSVATTTTSTSTSTTSTSTSTTTTSTSTTSTTVAAPPPPAAPVVSVGDAAVVEGDSGSVVAKVPLDMSTTTDSTVTATYSITADTALPGDFQAKTGTVSFAAGQASKQIPVTVFGDTTPEKNVKVAVRVTSVTANASIGDGAGGVTIIDDDANGPATTVEANVGDVTPVEGDSGTHTANLPVTLNVPAPGPLSFTYSIDCGLATAGQDYSEPATGTISFSAGQQSKDIPIHINPDTIREGAEPIAESLQPASPGAIVNRASGTATILDNDPLVVGGVEAESVAPDGSSGNYPDDSYTTPCQRILARAGASSISGNGQFVAFESNADNLVAGDTNTLSDLFVRDRFTGTTERVSVKSDGSQVTGADLPGGTGVAGYDPVLSSDGRYVVFDSYARLVAQDTNDGPDVYLYDRQAQTLDLISVALDGNASGITGGGPGESYALGADVSADGRYVAFESSAPNLVTSDPDPPADTSHPRGYWPDIFLRDRVSGTTQLISTVGDTGDLAPVMTPDAAKVAYVGPVTVGGTASEGIYVYDRASATTQLVSLTSTGKPTDQAIEPAISADGTKVAFRAFGAVVGAHVNQGVGHLYLRDLTASTTELVDVDSPTMTADREPYSPTLSADGRYVTFGCWCQRVVDGLAPGMFHEGIYQRDRTLGVTQEVDLNQQGIVADQDSSVAGHVHFASDDGALVVFGSIGANLVPADDNDHADIFVKRLR